jgi:hypothetical protein
VLVIGALSEWVVEKLVIDFPEQFHRCNVNKMRCSKEEIEMRLNNNSIIEYRRRGSLFECVSLQAVKDNEVRVASMVPTVLTLSLSRTSNRTAFWMSTCRPSSDFTGIKSIQSFCC